MICINCGGEDFIHNPITETFKCKKCSAVFFATDLENAECSRTNEGNEYEKQEKEDEEDEDLLLFNSDDEAGDWGF